MRSLTAILLLTACDASACLDAPPSLTRWRAADCTMRITTHAWNEAAAGQIARHVSLATDTWTRHGVAIEHTAERLDAYVPLVLATEPECDALATFDDRFADDGTIHVLAVLAIDTEERRFEGWKSGNAIALRLDAGRFTLAHEIGHALGLGHAPGLMEGDGEIVSDALSADDAEHARAQVCEVAT